MKTHFAPESDRPAGRVVLAVAGPHVAALHEAFRADGWEVHAASTLKDARRLVRSVRPNASVVLADSPRQESGWLACKKWLLERPDMRVVVVGPDECARSERFADFVGAAAYVPFAAPRRRRGRRRRTPDRVIPLTCRRYGDRAKKPSAGTHSANSHPSPFAPSSATSLRRLRGAEGHLATVEGLHAEAERLQDGFLPRPSAHERGRPLAGRQREKPRLLRRGEEAPPPARPNWGSAGRARHRRRAGGPGRRPGRPGRRRARG